jgi:GAF domain-containing protein
MCSPCEDEGSRQLVALLQDSRVHRARIKRDALQDLVRPNAPRRNRLRFPESYERIVKLLARVARERRANAAQVMMSDGAWAPVMGTTATDSARVTAAILLRFASEPPEPLGEISDLVDELITNVNGTAQADIRRDTATMSRVARRLSSTLSQDEFAAGAERLVAVASDVSSTGHAAVYLTTSAGDALKLVPGQGEPGHKPAGVEFPTAIPLDGTWVADAAVTRHRTIQTPPGLEDDQQLRSMIDSMDSPGLVELAIPIPGPMASVKEPAIGVLIVVKPDSGRLTGEVTAFGAYDLALLRNVALRIALLSATSRATELAAAGLALRWQPPDLMAGAPPAGRARGPRLPIDLEAASPGIVRGLRSLAEATSSQSATFRAALPYAATDSDYSQALVRIAATDRDPDDESTRIQTFEQGGYNWKAVLTGRYQNAPCVTDDPDFREHRPGTVSELALPVVVEGRVVGVINLESTREAAYDALAGFATGFAFQLGLAIADARLDSQTALQQHATEIVNRSHSLDAAIEELRKSPTVKDNPEHGSLDNQLGVLQQRAKELRSGPSKSLPDLRKPKPTLPDLLEATIQTIKAEINFEGSPEELDWEPYDATTTTIVTQILHNILTNITQHASVRDARASVRIRRGTWGGREEDIVVFQNLPNKRIDENATRNLYRVPRQVSLGVGSIGAPRIGAFLAGRLARSLNGELSATVTSRGELRSTLVIPTLARDRASWLLGEGKDPR